METGYQRRKQNLQPSVAGFVHVIWGSMKAVFPNKLILVFVELIKLAWHVC